MTAAQLDALVKIEGIMREHFDGGVVVVTAIIDEDGKRDTVKTSYCGGSALALGLLEFGKQHVFAIVGREEEDGG